MAVYIDDMYKTPIGTFRGMKMSHMIADSTEELLEMADAINVNRKWIQNPGTCNEHFDVCKSYREKAIKYGAIEITYLEYSNMIEKRCEKYGIHWVRASIDLIPRPIGLNQPEQVR
jgi:hypothetical protein